MENDVSIIQSKINHSEVLNIKNSINIIVNADDLGICAERDEGIFELYSLGVISSSTILVNAVNFENSIIKAKLIRMPLGLHLNLTEGSPINRKEIENNSLTEFDEKTNTYLMHGKFGLREKLSKGEINISDVKYEIISQVKCLKNIKRFLNLGNFTTIFLRI